MSLVYEEKDGEGVEGRGGAKIASWLPMFEKTAVAYQNYRIYQENFRLTKINYESRPGIRILRS